MGIAEWLTGVPGLASAGTAVVFTCIISGNQVYHHLRHYHNPQLQKYVIRIICMVPIYAVSCYAALAIPFMHLAYYFHAAREIYEAYLIYSFTALLLAYVGGQDELVMRCKEDGRRVPTFRGYIQAWTRRPERETQPVDYRYLRFCMKGVIQYVVWQVFYTVIMSTMDLVGLYESNPLKTDAGVIVETVVYNISVSGALCSLVLFYLACEPYLAPFRPVPKFLLVKGIVFVTFWQQVVISLVLRFSRGLDIHLHMSSREERDRMASNLQDYLICLETLPFAVAYTSGFQPQDFGEEQPHMTRPVEGLNDVISPQDFADAARDSFTQEIDRIVEVSRNVVEASPKQAKVKLSSLKWLLGRPRRSQSFLQRNRSRLGRNRSDLEAPLLGGVGSESLLNSRLSVNRVDEEEAVIQANVPSEDGGSKTVTVATVTKEEVEEHISKS